MQTRGTFALALAAIGVLSLAACSTAPTQPVPGSSQPAPSGFLKDYSLLAPDADTPGYRHYMAPGVNAGQYRSFIVDAPVFIINTQGVYDALSPDRLQEISNYYVSRLAAALGTHYRVVQKPGPGVARLRIAVVGLVEAGPQLKIRDLVPAKALFNVARMAVDETPHALRMSIESEARDSQTGKLLGAAVDSRQSRTTVSGRDTPPSDDQVHALVDYWVARFVARLDRANGYPTAADE
ncbi:DUF3313 domain-containing protein [Castellaniella sp.]|uniref:DUF3313 domain-containing protein n=1 Tax=Castellaniella sp. TaxID=1955812 RepID=UPI002AFE4971|nr:DUF3313 domain-containing protein [Castellaniella sp.]